MQKISDRKSLTACLCIFRDLLKGILGCIIELLVSCMKRSIEISKGSDIIEIIGIFSKGIGYTEFWSLHQKQHQKKQKQPSSSDRKITALEILHIKRCDKHQHHLFLK